MDDDALLALASDLVAKAASAIMAIKAAGFAVERKSDHSPVTEADRIAEALIVEGLRAATPDIPVIAEEEVAAGTAPAHAERFWLVDPLDGTREFAAGRDNFAVNIGLVVAAPCWAPWRCRLQAKSSGAGLALAPGSAMPPARAPSAPARHRPKALP